MNSKTLIRIEIDMCEKCSCEMNLILNSNKVFHVDFMNKFLNIVSIE